MSQLEIYSTYKFTEACEKWQFLWSLQYYWLCCILLQEDWDYLQLQVALLYNSETSGIPLHMQVQSGTQLMLLVCIVQIRFITWNMQCMSALYTTYPILKVCLTVYIFKYDFFLSIYMYCTYANSVYACTCIYPSTFIMLKCLFELALFIPRIDWNC